MLKLNIAVIGCGHWGKNLIRNFSELGALKYICDTDLESAELLAKIYNIEVKSFKEILNSGIEGIVIATPAVNHYTLAKQALTANKHVFVEKPLSLKTEEAQELCQIAQHKNKILMVGHLLQYHNAFLKLKNLVKEGELGKLQYIYSNRLNLGKFRNEENILWSFAPHDISMILSLTEQMPRSLYAAGSAYLNSHIQDVTTTHLSFENDIQAHIFVSWLHPFKEQKLIVIGNKAMIVFNDSLEWDKKLSLYSHQIDWINGYPQPKKADCKYIALEKQEPLKTECQHFLECISENKSPRTNGLEGLRVLRILNAAQQSLHTNNMIFLNSTEPKSYFVHNTSCIDDGCKIGKNTKIWHFCHILKGAKIGNNCTIGQNVMIGNDVIIGNKCKIQNNVSLYKGVTLEDGVFCGPSCVFTNVYNPRAEIERKDEFRNTYVERGATIGANATIICGNRIGAYSLIGAGSVVTKDVKPHAIIAGNPAKQIGWISHAGEILDDTLICSREKRKYQINHNGNLQETITA